MPVFSSKARSNALAARVATVLGGQVHPARMSVGLLTTARHVVKAHHSGMRLEVYVFEPWLEVWVQNFRLRGPDMSFAVSEPNRLMTLTEPVAGATLAGRPVFRRPWQPNEAAVRAFAAEAGNVAAVQRLSLAGGESLTILPEQITARLRAGDEAQIRERFEALAGLFARIMRPPPAVPALEIEPHAVVGGEPGEDASPHRFGGTIADGPDCGNCRRPLHQLLSLDTSAPPLAGPLRGLPRLPVAACLNCQTSSPLVLAHRDGRWTIREQAANASLDDFPAALPARPVRLEPGVFEGHRLGGTPDWIQSDETPDCMGCGEVMTFLAQIETDDRLGLQFGDEGKLYAFVCPRCVTVATLIQSH